MTTSFTVQCIDSNRIIHTADSYPEAVAYARKYEWTVDYADLEKGIVYVFDKGMYDRMVRVSSGWQLVEE